MGKPLSTREVASLLKMKPGLIKRWADIGVIRPSIGGGIQGKHFRFTPLDVLRFRVCRTMKAMGMKERVLRFTAESVKSWPESREDVLLITKDGAKIVAHNTKMADCGWWLGHLHATFICPIGIVAEELKDI